MFGTNKSVQKSTCNSCSKEIHELTSNWFLKQNKYIKNLDIPEQ